MVSKTSLRLPLEERFSAALKGAVCFRYGKLPSIAFLTIQFNRRTDQANGVSQESFRRWIRGLSMPSYANLQVIAEWLDLDIHTFIRAERKQPQAYSEQTMRIAQSIAHLPESTQGKLMNFVALLDPVKAVPPPPRKNQF